jgi:hypothetical protein
MSFCTFSIRQTNWTIYRYSRYHYVDAGTPCLSFPQDSVVAQTHCQNLSLNLISKDTTTGVCVSSLLSQHRNVLMLVSSCMILYLHFLCPVLIFSVILFRKIKILMKYISLTAPLSPSKSTSSAECISVNCTPSGLINLRGNLLVSN